MSKKLTVQEIILTLQIIGQIKAVYYYKLMILKKVLEQ